MSNEQRGWQPIRTAPKDGTDILAWRHDWGVMMVRWTSPEEFMNETELEKEGVDEASAQAFDWFCFDFIAGASRLEFSEVPSHWMPLPEEPR